MPIDHPKEPLDIKLFIKEVRNKSVNSASNIDWDSLAVWYLNRLPSYLWKNWKNELEKKRYTWQKFLKVIKLHTGDAILWALKDELSWEAFLKEIIKTLERYGEGASNAL